MARRIVFHIDVNSAFLSWTSVSRLKNGESDLRTVPAVISGDPDKRTSVVLAKSVPAKKYGINGRTCFHGAQKMPPPGYRPAGFSAVFQIFGGVYGDLPGLHPLP